MEHFPIKIKRIYETPSPKDGIRILVDRLWPRGVSKEHASIDYWEKEIAPSNDLRKWFGHKEENFKEFSDMYAKELASKKENLKAIKELSYNQPLTLIYAAKDPKINHATVLLKILKKI